MKVFVNYKQKVHPDHYLAKLLEEELAARSHQVFRDESGIIAGESWPQRLLDEVKACEVMVSLISNNALKSDWVLNEIDLAKKLGTPIIPFLLEKLDEALEFQAFKPRFMHIQYYQATGNDKADVKAMANRIDSLAGLSSSASIDTAHLLRSGVEGITEWNLRRSSENAPPSLDGMDYSNLDLREADLRRVSLADARLVKADLRNVDLSESDLSRAALIGANLRGANLSKATLYGADLSAADLTDAVLTSANLTSANLAGSNLRDSDITNAVLINANLHRAELTDASLESANLREANLSRATVASTDFKNAVFGNTTIATDLSEARGLEETTHWAPSDVSISSALSLGQSIPHAFLRGCGVPDVVVEYLRSLSQTPIEFYSCFISYSHEDEEFARRLYSRLRDEGIRVWFAPQEMKAGQAILEQIDQAVRVFDLLILVLSNSSIKSEWVASEYRSARLRERDAGRPVLFPIGLVPFETIQSWEHLDAVTGEDLASKIRNYFIPDFTDWKNHDSFEIAFQQLLKGLKSAR